MAPRGSTVGDLVAALPEGDALAYNSVLTTIRILEEKGYVTHRQEGRAFLHSPTVSESEASQTAADQLLTSVTDGKECKDHEHGRD